jgi:hypothetical protein
VPKFQATTDIIPCEATISKPLSSARSLSKTHFLTLRNISEAHPHSKLSLCTEHTPCANLARRRRRKFRTLRLRRHLRSMGDSLARVILVGNSHISHFTNALLVDTAQVENMLLLSILNLAGASTLRGAQCLLTMASINRPHISAQCRRCFWSRTREETFTTSQDGEEPHAQYGTGQPRTHGGSTAVVAVG